MHSLEYVKSELKKRGCQKSQINASVVPMVLDIVSGTDRAWSDYDEALKSLEAEKVALTQRKRDTEALLTRDMHRRAMEAINIANERERASKERAELAAEIEAVETATAKDRVRLAKFFIANTDPDDKSYTAYVYGLGAILGGVSWSDHFNERVNEREDA